jgi:hypothetical protein
VEVQPGDQPLGRRNHLGRGRNSDANRRPTAWRQEQQSLPASAEAQLHRQLPANIRTCGLVDGDEVIHLCQLDRLGDQRERAAFDRERDPHLKAFSIEPELAWPEAFRIYRDCVSAGVLNHELHLPSNTDAISPNDRPPASTATITGIDDRSDQPREGSPRGRGGYDPGRRRLATLC